MAMATKKSKVKNIRNILESPFHIQRSERNLEEIVPVQNALKELLPVAKLEKKNHNLQLKGSKIKGSTAADSKGRPDNIYRAYLAPGFQSVVRGLEKNDLCCVTMSSDITPAFLQNVVFAYAQTRSVPVIIIPDLKSITKYALGFATMVLGFKSIVAESAENQFNPIYKLVSQHPSTSESPFLVKAKEDITTLPVIEDSFRKECSLPLQLTHNHSYLYRNSCFERTFIPVSKTNDNKTISFQSKDKNIDDYICIGKTPHSTSNYSDIIKQEFVQNESNLYEEDDDDDESEEDNNFFVDVKPDESLLKTQELQISKPVIYTEKKIFNKSWNLNGSKHNKNSQFNKDNAKTTSSGSKFKSKKSKTPCPEKHLKNISFSEKKTKKQVNNSSNHLNAINFRPLSIKVVTCNTKKNKRKKKKK